MTILGKHTIEETNDYMKTIEFRAAATEKVYASIPAGFAAAFPDKFKDLSNDWANWKNRWKIARQGVQVKLIALNISQPLVPASIIPCEDLYMIMLKAEASTATQSSGGQTYVKGDFVDCINRIEAAAGTTINEKKAPAPTGFDPDLGAYSAVDATIKEGEAAANAAAAAAKQAASNHIPLIIGLTALGLAGTYVAVKVYT